MKFSLIVSLLMFMSLVACKKHNTTEAPQTTASSVYACPMKCEGEKTYSGPGKCPVCGMDLIPMDQSAMVSYEMLLTTDPVSPEAGKPTRLSFMPRVSGDASKQVPLDEVHEQKLHVIIVSEDLGWYDHIHPSYQADGHYTIDETFPAGGQYIVFADYQPTGAGNQVQRHTLQVAGTPKVKETFNQQVLTTKTDNYVVTLKPQGGKLITNNMMHMGVEVTENGKPVTDFENIMGAKGHLVIISGDGQKYLHVHPDEVEGKLDMHTQFEQAGFYRAFFQFQTDGKLRTSYFTLDVKEGKPGEMGGHDDHGHSHGEGGDQHSHGEEEDHHQH